GTLQSTRWSLIFVAKQIHLLSGDQQGEESSSRVLVNCLMPLPSRLATHRSTAPLLLKIIATFEPSGDGAGLMFDPANRATPLRAPVSRSCRKMSGLPRRYDV